MLCKADEQQGDLCKANRDMMLHKTVGRYFIEHNAMVDGGFPIYRSDYPELI